MPIIRDKRPGENLLAICQEFGVATIVRTKKGDRMPISVDSTGIQGPIVSDEDIPTPIAHLHAAVRYVGLGSGSPQFEEVEFDSGWHEDIKKAVESRQLVKFRDDECGHFYKFADLSVDKRNNE